MRWREEEVGKMMVGEEEVGKMRWREEEVGKMMVGEEEMGEMMAGGGRGG